MFDESNSNRTSHAAVEQAEWLLMAVDSTGHDHEA